MGLHGAECRDTFVFDASLSLEKLRLRNVSAHIAHWGWVAAGSGPAQDRFQVSSSLVSLTAQHTALPCLLPPHCLVPVSSKPFSFSFLTRVPSSPSRSSAEGLAKDDLRFLILLPPKFWDYTCAPPCLPGVIFYSSFLCGCIFGEELN